MLIDFIRYVDPDPLQLAHIYLYVSHLEIRLNLVIRYLETHMIEWNWVFLSELKHPLIERIDQLWAQYKDKIVVLNESDYCSEWSQLKQSNPSEDQIYAFIGAMIGY